MSKYVIFHVEGGLGKNVSSTSVVRCIKNKYPKRKLIVVASWPGVFINNPYVDKVYRLGVTPYFYDEYIKGKDTFIYRHEPYNESLHIHKKQCLSKSWCDLIKVPFDENQPELYFNASQKDFVNAWHRPKPILLLHTNGGPMGDQPYNHSWTRDMPQYISQNIVNEYSQKYHIIQICRHESQKFTNVESHDEQMDIFNLFSLLMVSQKRVLIDSCLQHAAAALKIPSTVLWIGTSPTTFGYEIHNNIVANEPSGNFKLPDSYLFDYQFSGQPFECPYNDWSELFDYEQIRKYL